MEFPFEVLISDMTPALLLGLLEDDLWLDGYAFQYFVPEEQTDPVTGVPIAFPVGESHREEIIVYSESGAMVAGVSVLRVRLNTVRLSVYGVTADQDAADQFAAALEAVLVDIGVMDEPALRAHEPGRRTEPKYDWAYGQIKNGRTIEDFWAEYQDKYCNGLTAGEVADERERLRSAMNYRRKRRK